MNAIYERQPFAIYAYHSTEPKIEHPAFHFHNNYELLLCLRGNMEFLVEQSRYVAVPGTLFAISTEEVHKGMLLDSSEYERCVVHFSASIIQPLLGYDAIDLLACFNSHAPGFQNAVVLEDAELEEFCRIFRQIQQVLEQEPYGRETLKITYMAQLLIMVNRVFAHTNVPPSSPVSAFVAAVMKYVDTHLSQPLSLENIAGDLYMDKYYLSHQFKKQTGDSLYHFILMKRIALARRLLTEGNSVAEVCEQAGFNNYNNFIRTFRKYTGMPPGEYRKLQRE